MTCTSGPGISLTSEFVGLAYYAEIFVVIIDVQRVGPCTAALSDHPATPHLK